ncbi:MAG: hypothetical protein QXQ94_10835 [Candidatus Bathyarchaeia archaeon]
MSQYGRVSVGYKGKDQHGRPEQKTAYPISNKAYLRLSMEFHTLVSDKSVKFSYKHKSGSISYVFSLKFDEKRAKKLRTSKIYIFKAKLRTMLFLLPEKVNLSL